MKLALFIAKRYFLSRKKQNFINIISWLAILGVSLSTAALIIVLSVFNGLEELIFSLHASFDPEIKIEARKGKSFKVTPDLISKIDSIQGVEIVTEVIEEYVYLRYRKADKVVVAKGISDNFIGQYPLKERIIQGSLELKRDGIRYAVIGRGVRYELSIDIENDIYPLQVFYAKNVSSSSSLNPSGMYSKKNIQPGGVFSIEKKYDENYIFLPFEFMQELSGYQNRLTSIEVKTSASADKDAVQKKIKEAVGTSFIVLSNKEQQKNLHRLFNIEKLFTFLSLSLLILIGSINTFFSLMMLVLDKKKDLAVLSALGARKKFIKAIFLCEGALISFSGAVSGLILGAFLCWLQKYFGLVSMGMENAVVVHYPIKMIWIDFASISCVVLSVTLLVSFYPATLASKFYSK